MAGPAATQTQRSSRPGGGPPGRPAFRRPARSSARTVVLVVVALVILAVGFGFYQMYTEASPAASRVERGADLVEQHREFLDSPAGETGLLIDDLPVAGGEHSGISILDDDSLRTKYSIKTREWRRAEGSSQRFIVVDPVITYYLDKGQQVQVRADRGEVHSRTGDGLNPQSGRLEGNVRVDVDRTTSEWRDQHLDGGRLPTPQQYLVRVWLEQVEFDLDLGQMQAAGAVKIESEEMILEGRGLSASWSEQSGRLQSLKLEEGIRLVIPSDSPVGAQLAEIRSLGNGPDEGAAGDPDAANNPGAAENSGTAAGPSSTAAAAPAPAEPERPKPRAPAPPPGPDVLVIDLPDTPQKPPEDQIVSYRAEFRDEVAARQVVGAREDSKLLADLLSIVFDLPAAYSEKQRTAGGEAPADAAGPPSAPPPDAAPSTRAELVLTWTGPLEINATSDPFPRGDQPLRRQLTAEGRQVRLEGPDWAVTTAKLTHDTVSDITKLFAAPPDGPSVVIESGKGRLRAAGHVHVDRRAGRVELRDRVLLEQEDLLLEGPSIDASFDVKPGAGRGLLDRLAQVECREGVRLTQGQDAVKCEQLQVWFERGEQGHNLPSHALATGEVMAFRGKTRIYARDEMDIRFGGLPIGPDGKPASRAPMMKRLTAAGDVSIVDPAKGWDIGGDRLECNFDDQQVLTYGSVTGTAQRWARVRLGAYEISGSTVTFDADRQWAEVPGPGTASFVLDTGLDGRATAAPVPVKVSWSSRMELSGNVVTLSGLVEVVSSDNNLISREGMRIVLADAGPRPAVQTASSDPWGLWMLRPFEHEIAQADRWLGRDRGAADPLAERFRKRVREIEAVGEAELQSRRLDPSSNTLTSRLSLGGPRIVFDIDAQVMLVDGAGHLLIEDYPRPKAAAGGSGAARGLFGELESEGASQTLISWRRSMRYYFGQQQSGGAVRAAAAHFDGGDQLIRLLHRAGAKIREMRGVDPATLEMSRASADGREVALHCQSLFVEFAEAGGRRSAGGVSDMAMGQLKAVHATGRIDLVEPGRMKVTGERLDFFEDQELIELYGAVNDDAYVSYETSEFRCPKIVVELRTGRIDTPGCALRLSR